MAGRGRGMTTPAWMTQGMRPAEQAPGGLQPPYMPQQPPAIPPPYTMYGGGPPPPYGAQPPPPMGGSYPPQFPPPQGAAPPPFPYPAGAPGGGYGMPPARPFEGDTDRRRRRGRSADGDDSRKKPYASSRVGGSDRTTLRARRLYVKGTEHLTERELKDFFNSILHESAGIENGALAVTVNEKNFAFVEFSEVEVMHAFLEMGAIPYKGRVLLLQKPRDYELLRPLGQIPFLDLSKVTNPDLTASMLPKTTKVKLVGLTPNMSEVTVAELLAPFGELASSPMVTRDPRTGKPEGIAFAEFADVNAADAAVIKHTLTASTGEVVTVMRAPVTEERSNSASRPRDSRPPRRDSPGGMPPPRQGGGRGGAFPPPYGAGGGPGQAPFYPPPPGGVNGGAPFYGGGMPPPGYGGGDPRGAPFPPPPGSFPPPPSMSFPYPPPPGGAQQPDPRQQQQAPPPGMPPPYGQPPSGGLPPMFANNNNNNGNQPPPSYPPGVPPPYGAQGPPPQQQPPPYGGNYGPPGQQQQQQPLPAPPQSYYPPQGPPALPPSQQYNNAPPSQTGSSNGSGYPPLSGPPSASGNGMYAQPAASSSSQPTSVLLLLNMVTREELANQEDYQEILEDTESEARKFGSVERVVIPRSGPGVERVFIKYKAPLEAKAAFQALNGRKFSHRTVEARYYNEDVYAVGNLGM